MCVCARTHIWALSKRSCKHWYHHYSLSTPMSSYYASCKRRILNVIFCSVYAGCLLCLAVLRKQNHLLLRKTHKSFVTLRVTHVADVLMDLSCFPATLLTLLLVFGAPNWNSPAATLVQMGQKKKEKKKENFYCEKPKTELSSFFFKEVHLTIMVAAFVLKFFSGMKKPVPFRKRPPDCFLPKIPGAQLLYRAHDNAT